MTDELELGIPELGILLKSDSKNSQTFTQDNSQYIV